MLSMMQDTTWLKQGGGDQKKNKQEDFNLLLLSVA